MGNKTAISWTDATWSPIRGCSRVSAGCQNCYAEVIASRFSGPGQPFEGFAKIGTATGRWTGRVELVPKNLTDPLRWRAPRRIFLTSMSDVFHEKLTNEEIAALFAVMASAPRHTFQVLTKRAARMREWFDWASDLTPSVLYSYAEHAIQTDDDRGRMLGFLRLREAWPLPNVWLGVSVENQAAADERIPELLATPAAVRFLSCEPLLGQVHLHSGWTGGSYVHPDPLTGKRIDWVIAGCESGRHARPCDLEWLRSLRDQCAASGVPFFCKQAEEQLSHSTSCAVHPISVGAGSKRKNGAVIELPYLDGVQHANFPRNS